jgi:hypothetical protein
MMIEVSSTLANNREQLVTTGGAVDRAALERNMVLERLSAADDFDVVAQDFALV